MVTSQTLTIPRGSSPKLMARVTGQDGVPVTPASVASVSYLARDLVTRQVLGSGSLTVANVLYTQLQKGLVWREDAVGYNFLFQAPAGLTSGPGNQAEVRVTLVDTQGRPIVVPFRFNLE